VKSYLVGQGGLSASNLRTAGYGETRLVRPGAAGPGAAGIENRRVTFVVEWTQAGGSSAASTTEPVAPTGSS
jgi:outer membrane protein OmpA-like peptidoglycan-associated protein